MKYQGGKTTLARSLASVMSPSLAGRGGRYVEPFVGSCAVAVQMTPHASVSALSDAHLDVVLMWQALADGWEPPSTVTRAEYDAARLEEVPSARRGFIGTACSYAGKWFGGFASGEGRNFAGEGRRSVLRRSSVLRASGADVVHRDYRDSEVSQSDVVYLDPPYAGTTKYAATGIFDSIAFWDQAEKWVATGAVVYVSEFDAPPGWVSVWSKSRHSSTALNNTGARSTDRLFVHESQSHPAR